MRIKVRSLQGEEHYVDVQNDQLISELKAKVSEKFNGLPIDRQKLVYKGRTMQDACLVSEYNFEEDGRVYLILQKEQQNITPTDGTSSSGSKLSDQCPMDVSNRLDNEGNSITMSTTTSNASNQGPPSRFEVILRERLAEHFEPEAVEKIMSNLQQEINADINSSSLDDLERLAKQKLNISNE